MSESAVLLLAILVAAVAVAGSVAISLARVAPPAAAGCRTGPLPVSVLCPATGDLAFAELGFNWGTGELSVASCERFPTGAFECDRDCFPTRVLTPVAAGLGSPA